MLKDGIETNSAARTRYNEKKLLQHGNSWIADAPQDAWLIPPADSPTEASQRLNPMPLTLKRWPIENTLERSLLSRTERESRSGQKRRLINFRTESLATRQMARIGKQSILEYQSVTKAESPPYS